MAASLPIVIAMAAFIFGGSKPPLGPDAELAPIVVTKPQLAPVEQDDSIVLAQAPEKPIQPAQPATLDKVLEALEGVQKELREQNQRLERLESGQTQAPAAPPSRPRGTAYTGWEVEAFAWNREIDIRGEPLQKFYLPNERFDGHIGHPAALAQQFYIYRFKTTLRVRKAGKYSFNTDLRCRTHSACNFMFRIGVSEKIRLEKANIERPWQTTVDLDPIDYPLEIIFAWNGGGDTSYSVDRFSFLMSFKAPEDQGYRQFKPGEIISYRPLGAVGGNSAIGVR